MEKPQPPPLPRLSVPPPPRQSRQGFNDIKRIICHHVVATPPGKEQRGRTPSTGTGGGASSLEGEGTVEFEDKTVKRAVGSFSTTAGMCS